VVTGTVVVVVGTAGTDVVEGTVVEGTEDADEVTGAEALGVPAWQPATASVRAAMAISGRRASTERTVAARRG
jgi:hypothetical protein